MMRTYQIVIVTIALLFSVQTLQAAPFPDYTFPTTLEPGDSVSSPDFIDDYVFWFEFTLGSLANVSLDTLSSIDGIGDEYDTILALYDDSGALVVDDDGNTQADGCTTIFASCQTFSSLAGGTYIAGVAEYDALFESNWTVSDNPLMGHGEIILSINVSAVPVPAAVWLFGTALIGFVGMSRRTSIKT